jgi:hypothetical protein
VNPQRRAESTRDRFLMIAPTMVGLLLLINGIDGVGTLRNNLGYRWLNIGLGACLFLFGIYRFGKFRKDRDTVD